MIKNMLRDELAAALKAANEHDDQRTIAVIRLVQVALKERDDQVRDEGRDHLTSDPELIQMLESMVEQRLQSQRRYEENGQLELADREAEEIEVGSEVEGCLGAERVGPRVASGKEGKQGVGKHEH